MTSPGIHLRLMAAGVLLIAAATFTLDIVGVEITRRFMHDRFADRIAFLARYLALNSEVGVLIGDKAGLKSLALNLLGEEDVARVRISDADGAVLVDIAREISGPISVVDTPVEFKQAREESVLFEQTVSTPFGDVTPRTREAIGRVEIHYSTHTIRRLMVHITSRFALYSLLLVVVSGVVYFFLSRSIVTDVRRLVKTARKVGKGNLALRAEPGRLPETGELAAAFNAMLDSLESSREALDQANREMFRQRALAEMGKFSMMIAHEVKNPLGIIKSSFDLLKQDAGWADSPETGGQKSLLAGYIDDEILRLNRLIEDFLSFARPAKPSFRETDLNEMLRDIAARFALQYDGTGPLMEADVPDISFCREADRDLLVRAVSNIVKNAGEAAGPSGTVRITSRVSEDGWRVLVTDTGDGIAEGSLQEVFEPFYTTRSKGTGLGLAFARQIATAHGGALTAENREEGGARFILSLPGPVEPAAQTVLERNADGKDSDR
ncbi:MAG: two-component sensor histidine kinase [Desulfobacterales bacterium]|nr:MAG: two-component sensor histidine kinase [Desulfobacterales bacterium]